MQAVRSNECQEIPEKNPVKVIAWEEKRNASRKIKDAHRSRNLQKFGLSIEMYNLIHDAQGGVCAICKEPETSLGYGGKEKSLAVDHCHTTQNVRGLLCSRCNPMIGYALDNVKILKNAIQYLHNTI